MGKSFMVGALALFGLSALPASSLARKLRDFDDGDLARMPHLSDINLAKLCAHFETVPSILDLARRYEQARRRVMGARLHEIDGMPASDAELRE